MSTKPLSLTEDQCTQFHQEGFLILRGAYDLDREITPVQKDIYRIIGLLLEKYQIPFVQEPFSPEHFDSGCQELLNTNRKYISELYDAVKHIPAFVRLACSEKHDYLMKMLRSTDMPAIPSGGYGIRIDNPGEVNFRANWHQDYPSQLRSMDGLIFWSPLVSLPDELGPLQIAKSSHQDGLFPLLTNGGDNSQKSGAYSLRLHDEEKILSKYEKVTGYAEPGDLIVIDYLNLHASGFNTSKRSRWSMQMRYFNFREPKGIGYSWVGSYAAGVNVQTIHPELFVD